MKKLRKSDAERLDYVLSCRFKEHVWDEIVRCAKRAGLTPSEYVRQAVAVAVQADKARAA